jgi:hypothetical protein
MDQPSCVWVTVTCSVPIARPLAKIRNVAAARPS